MLVFRVKPEGRVPLTREKDLGVAPPAALMDSEYGLLKVPDSPLVGVDIVNSLETVKDRCT